MDLRLLAVALAFAGMGALALVRPAAIGRFFDVRIESVGGRNEVRAVYGGFGLAMATALCLAINRLDLRAGVVACIALALAGMATGRLISAALERPGPWPWFFCALEAAGAALLASTLR
jgi:hypothetical protein